MDIKITEKKEEGPLSRVKLTGEIIFESVTPSYEEVRKKISSSVDCDEKLIVIKNIYTKFGLKKASVSAYAYKNEDAMKKIEPKPKEKKAKEKSAEMSETQSVSEHAQKSKISDKPEEAKKQEEKKEQPAETKEEKKEEPEKKEDKK